MPSCSPITADALWRARLRWMTVCQQLLGAVPPIRVLHPIPLLPMCMLHPIPLLPTISMLHPIPLQPIGVPHHTPLLPISMLHTIPLQPFVLTLRDHKLPNALLQTTTTFKWSLYLLQGLQPLHTAAGPQ